MEKITFNYDNLGRMYDTGFESNIVTYVNKEGKWELLKYFKRDLSKSKPLNYLYKDDKELSDEDIKRNKEKKLELLSKIDDDRIVKVHELVYDEDKFVGYTMDEIKGTRFEPLGSTRKEKIDYLTQIKDTMLSLNDKGIFIGDFNSRNFLVDDQGKVFNIDIDNYKVNDLDFDTSTTYMREYNQFGGDKKLIDRYCFNMFAISILGRYALGYFNIDDVRLPFYMRNKYNNEVRQDMYMLGKNYKGKILEFKKKN